MNFSHPRVGKVHGVFYMKNVPCNHSAKVKEKNPPGLLLRDAFHHRIRITPPTQTVSQLHLQLLQGTKLLYLLVVMKKKTPNCLLLCGESGVACFGRGQLLVTQPLACVPTTTVTLLFNCKLRSCSHALAGSLLGLALGIRH